LLNECKQDLLRLALGNLAAVMHQIVMIATQRDEVAYDVILGRTSKFDVVSVVRLGIRPPAPTAAPIVTLEHLPLEHGVIEATQG
jgi:hypothetical protein